LAITIQEHGDSWLLNLPDELRVTPHPYVEYRLGEWREAMRGGVVVMVKRSDDKQNVAVAEQAMLPLPYDDEADLPVAFELTARARRTVAPESLPPLRLVDNAPASHQGHDPDDRSDTRPARARAMMRAGMSPTAIARQLDVDDLLVRAWTGATLQATPNHIDMSATSTKVSKRSDDASNDHQRQQEWIAKARAQATTRLLDDADFARGLGMLAGTGVIDDHAVTITTGDQRIARCLVEWATTWLPEVEGRFRVVLRVGPDVAADVARFHWAQALSLEVADIGVARSRLGRPRPGPHSGPHAGSRHGSVPPSANETQAIIRLADPQIAATLTGWLSSLLEPSHRSETGIAF